MIMGSDLNNIYTDGFLRLWGEIASGDRGGCNMVSHIPSIK